MTFENDCRKLIPRINFQKDYANSDLAENTRCSDLIGIYDKDFVLVECDELRAKKFTEAFENESFEDLIDDIVSTINNRYAGEGVYFIKSVDDNVHIRFFICEYGEKEFKEVVGDPLLEINEALGHVWVVSKEQFSSEKMREHLINNCEVIVDLNGLCLWQTKHEEFYKIEPEDILHLPEPSVFNHADYIAVYDGYVGTEGAFKASSRGLRLYDPVLNEFVKFSRKSSEVKTIANRVLFRQSYNSFYYLFEIDLTLGKIKHRYYKGIQPEVLDLFRKRYGNLEAKDFQVTGNL